MSLGQSHHARRAGAGNQPQRKNPAVRSRRVTPLGDAVRAVLSGQMPRSDTLVPELAGLPWPELLWADGSSEPEPDTVANLIDLAFLGRASAGELDVALDAQTVGGGSNNAAATRYADDLYLSELIASCFCIRVGGRPIPTYAGFLERALTTLPADLGTVQLRQQVLRELETNRDVCTGAERLAVELSGLVNLLRASRDDARLEPIRYRLDVLQAFRQIVHTIADELADASSALAHVRESGEAVRGTEAFANMEALLDHENSMASVTFEVQLGAAGRLRHLKIVGVSERRQNPFYWRPIRRWFDRLRTFYRRYDVRREELVDELIMAVYQEIAPAMTRLLQLTGPLQLYLAARTFAAEAHKRGLEVCLPTIAHAATMEISQLFNPLLLALTGRPVPCDIGLGASSRVVLVTGPNSGGKTRLLQAVGIAQVLGQSGLYVPAARATLPLAPGLFASIVEVDRADQSEGRLGTELVRLRTLFENAPLGSLVLLDELCAGTNPSEAIEIVDMVLRLLRMLEPVAFVTTHFLDFAAERRRTSRAENNGLEFLQAEVDADRGPSFQFREGVASTSLAVGTAHRLGVEFEELRRRLNVRLR
jgi:DNA mismatch repair protein MutS2